jgi:DNA-binding transcriptional ArsR family regulator
MAVKRCIPTGFFKNPDIAGMDHDSQLILIGLALSGDDEGRGVADAKLLGREIDYPPEHIEAALTSLEEVGLIALYQAGRHRYYQIVEDWQKSMGAKRTRSKLPAPPTTPKDRTELPPESTELPPESTELPPESTELPPESTELPPESTSQYNLIKVNLIEEEEKQKASSSCGDGIISLNDVKIKSVSAQVAAILRLPVTPALMRVVTDFLATPAISLTGEADMAREYIDSPTRNKKRKAMSPAFFRQWLKRELESRKAAEPVLSDGKSGGKADGARAAPACGGLAGRSLMGLGDRYQARSTHDSPTGAPAPPPSSSHDLRDQERGGAHG